MGHLAYWYLFLFNPVSICNCKKHFRVQCCEARAVARVPVPVLCHLQCRVERSYFSLCPNSFHLLSLGQMVCSCCWWSGGCHCRTRDKHRVFSLCPNKHMHSVGCFRPVLVIFLIGNHILWKSNLWKGVFILAPGLTVSPFWYWKLWWWSLKHLVIVYLQSGRSGGAVVHFVFSIWFSTRP